MPRDGIVRSSLFRHLLERPINLRVLALLIPVLAACAPQAGSPSDTRALDNEARRLMGSEDVKGMALAVIDDGKVEYVTAYGYRNVEKALPLETASIMYAASFTKTAFAYMVLQLADEGMVDLDRPLASYLDKPIPEYERYADLSGDDRWRRLSARHVLNHSTGFANFRWLEPDRRLRFHFQPGARYAYSGEGFYLLQFTLEEGLGLDVKDEMQRRVFDRFGMTNTSMQWRDDFASNLADGYAIDGTLEPHDERSNVSAAGSMDSTIADQAKMWAGIVRGDGLTPASRAELIKPQLAIATAHQFPTLWDTYDERGEQIGLSAGLGLVTFRGGWFKGGHNDWTGNIAVCIERTRRCAVLMANSVRAEMIYPALVTEILGATDMPWWWEYQYTDDDRLSPR